MTDLLDRAKRFLMGRQTAYRVLFQGPQADEVLADLAKFCRAHDSCYNADARIHAVLEGRREVFLRITRHLKLSDDELWRLYGKADGAR